MSSDTDGPTQIAIACQGGGSHNAFTAGVLQELLDELADDPSYEIVSLSGASGGAICATAAWYGLQADGPALAIDTLSAIWAELAATSPVDRVTNELFVASQAFAVRGGPSVEVSPYAAPFESLGRQTLLDALRSNIEFDRFGAFAEDSELDLVVSAAEVTEGEFATFHNEAVTARAILASAAVPTFFQAVEIGDNHYWDGLFSQNPPIRDLLTMPETAAAKPDEIWIVQTNPTERETVPRTTSEITDRRNELSANLSLFQEVAFIRKVNDWLETEQLSGEYKQVGIEFIELDRPLSTVSALDRDPDFIEELLRQGREQARQFLDE